MDLTDIYSLTQNLTLNLLTNSSPQDFGTEGMANYKLRHL